MKKRFFYGEYFFLMLSLLYFFYSCAHAMEEERGHRGKTTVSSPLSIWESFQIEQNPKAEEKAKGFLTCSPQEMSQEEAGFLIDFASLSTLDALFRLQNSNTQVLKATCLKMHVVPPILSSARRSFELVHYLWFRKVLMDEEKNVFLTSFVGVHGTMVLSLCEEKEKPYRDFMKENKSALLAGTKGYMMRHKAATFWTAWVEYIEQNPTEDQWEKATTASRTEALACRNCPDLAQKWDFRAKQYTRKLKAMVAAVRGKYPWSGG